MFKAWKNIEKQGRKRRKNTNERKHWNCRERERESYSLQKEEFHDVETYLLYKQICFIYYAIEKKKVNTYKEKMIGFESTKC